jgi:hypothetical protein
MPYYHADRLLASVRAIEAIFSFKHVVQIP